MTLIPTQIPWQENSAANVERNPLHVDISFLIMRHQTCYFGEHATSAPAGEHLFFGEKFTVSCEIEPVRRSYRRRGSCTFTEVARLVPSGLIKELSLGSGSLCLLHLSIYLSLCISMYLSLSLYTYIYIYITYIYIYIYIYIGLVRSRPQTSKATWWSSLGSFVHPEQWTVCIYIYIYIYITCMYIYIYIHIYIYNSVYIYIYIYIYTYTYIHT